MSVTIKTRRDTAANWTSVNPILSAGELGYETDTGMIKIGDGATAWTGLTYDIVTLAGAQTITGVKTLTSPVLTGTPTYPADTIHAAALAADVARANLLVNGGFEIAQRGVGPFTATGSWTLDRWQMTLVNSTASITQAPTNGGGSAGQSLWAAYTHVAGGQLFIAQPVEGASSQLRNKTVTVSVMVQSSVAGTVFIQLEDDIGTGSSAMNVGVGVEMLTATRVVDAAATHLFLNLMVSTASCTVQFNDAMLCISPVAVDYVPLTPAEDLARCLRYYEVWGGESNYDYFAAGYCVSTIQAEFMFHYAAPKGGVPTVTVAAPTKFSCVIPANIVAATAVSPGYPTLKACRLLVDVAAGLTAGQGVLLRAGNDVTPRIIVEWNP